MIVAKITPEGSVIKTHRAKAVTDDNGVQHPANIFRLWSDAELNAIGYAPFDEIKPAAGTISTGTVDTFANGRVTRTHTTVADAGYLDKRKAEVKRQIKGKRDSVATAGIEHTIDVTTYIVQTDTNSQMVLTGAMVAMDKKGNPNAKQKWRMADNTVVEIAKADFEAMGLAVRDHVDACYVRQAQLEATVDACEDVTTLEAIDTEAGWPTHYQAPEV